MRDYQQGKIYKIECLNTGKIYIGSTCQKLLSQRLADHVRYYKMFLKEKFGYLSSYEVLKGGNYQITLIKLCPCNRIDDLLMEERRAIEENDCVNVCKRPKVTEAERKEICRKIRIKWEEHHREEEILRKRNWYKTYHELHGEEERLKARNYREQNREQINAYGREWARVKSLYLRQLKYYNI